MEILKNKKIKFLIAAVVGFVLFFLGSLLYIYGIYNINIKKVIETKIIMLYNYFIKII